MKKILSIFMTAVMVITCFGMYTTDVSAADKRPVQRNLIKQHNDEAEYKEGEALVVFRTSGTSPKKLASDMVETESDIEIDSLWSFEMEPEAVEEGRMKQLKGTNDFLNIALVKSSTKTTKQLIKELEAKKNVEYAEPNYRIHINSNDTYFTDQWNLKNTGQNGGTEGKSTNVEMKWNKGITGSEDAVVAVVDTGVYYPHEDLKDNMWENEYQPDLKGDYGYDFCNGDSDPIDDNGHGTHCAGIIGASANNAAGISGINQDVQIMALKILDDDGSGWASDEVSAYHYIYKAMRLGVNVVAVNNSWGGGGSTLFKELIDLVGKKGAVTVCAAGNEMNDNDEYEEYPVDIDSPYLLSVAASNENNELAGFSNYGETTVDLAAPGTNILSTVSYGSYNPSLYDANKQAELSEKYADFDTEEPEWNFLEEYSLSNEASNIDIEVSESVGFGDKGSKSLKLTFKGMKAGESASIKIPYELTEDFDVYDDSKIASVMAKVKGPEGEVDGLFSFGSGAFFIADQARTAPEFDLYTSESDYVYGTYISGENNYWDHFEVYCGNFEEKPELERDIVIGMYAEVSGDFEVYLDDFGISETVTDESVFGRYDFYNGTSMATPHVTGAVALAAAENPDADAAGLIDAVLTHVKEDENLKGKVITDGVLDFSSQKELVPRIASVKVDIAADEIIINGGGLAKASDVEINEEKAEIISQTANEIRIKDNGWINNVVTISATGGGKTVTKKNIYLVNGKTEYTAMDELFEFPSSSCALASGTKKIYAADSDYDVIYMANTADGKAMEFEEIIEVDATKYFKKDAESKADYDFAFGKDLAYTDGKLYSIVAYSEVGVTEEDDWDDMWSNDYYFDDEEDYIPSSPAAFSSQYKLMAFNVSDGTIEDLGALDPALKRIEDCTLAGYNGKLYVMGGYDYSTKDLSTKVMIYDPAKKKWSEGPSLPEGRADGKAIQSGNSLVYTLGYGTSQKGANVYEQDCPANLILQNGKWTVSEVQTSPYYIDNVVTRNGVEYAKFNATVGLCENGVLYAGLPTAGLGDTYIYYPSKDTYEGTKYNFIDLEDENTFTGVMVKDTLYGFDDYDYCYKAVISSGLVKVTTPKKYTWGTVKGINTSHLPGAKITVKAVPKDGYYVKSFYLDGKKVNGTSKTFRITKNQVAKVTFGKYVTKITLNKTSLNLKDGKTYTLKAKVSPSNATDKAVTYKSSNTKYATVTSKGVIKAKRAGIGKTVKITVKAKDGSGVKKVCKVKIID